MLTLLPAVDVSDGRAVQLVQGKAGSERVFGEPREAALRWQQQGAEWIHLVDLDAAFGRGSNAPLLAEVIGTLDVQVELSGGIRDDESLRRALSTGARRVNIGTAALEDPDWCDRVIGEYGDRVAIGLDVRGSKLAARGWTRDGGELYEVLERLEKAGCARYVVTDVASDGMLSGPNLGLLRDVCARSNAPVIASGGVSSLDDLRALAGLAADGVEGAIAGTALYTGAFTVAEALAVLREDGRHLAVEDPTGLGVGDPGGVVGRRGPGPPRIGEHALDVGVAGDQGGLVPTGQRHVRDRALRPELGPLGRRLQRGFGVEREARERARVALRHDGLLVGEYPLPGSMARLRHYVKRLT